MMRAPSHFPTSPADHNFDQGFFDDLKKGLNQLPKTVLSCVPHLRTTPDGIERRYLLNKVKARGLNPSEQEFRKALDELVTNRDIKKSTRKGIEYWVRIR